MQKNIVIIGAGTMGNGIAHTFAQNNFKVELVDVNIESLDKAIQTISNNLDRMVVKEKISELEKKKHTQKYHQTN
jgi:3-hydroxybutyryl-CoA dehydrogenase